MLPTLSRRWRAVSDEPPRSDRLPGQDGGVLGHLLDVMSALDDRATVEPRLERYRVPADPAALDGLPDGWVASDAITLIATQGGWWPGAWWFPRLNNIVPLVLTGHDETPPDASIRWTGVGCVWERDTFYTPTMRSRSATAPLFGFSDQALWASMVFPSEAALLEAFLVTYDEMGLDDQGEINPFFVEWVTRAPADLEQGAAHRAHRRLVELAQGWTSDHPCWEDSAMPCVSWEPGAGDWDDNMVAAILGLPPA
jgi:hypothetical protein